MGDISKNFNRKEFTCGDRCGFDNIAPALVDTVQAIRDAAGVPVIISSGCRCKKWNVAKGGVSDSSHLSGLAADIYIKGWSNIRLGNLIKRIHSDGKLPFLRYCYRIKGKTDTAVHVDVDGTKKDRWRIFAF